MSELRLKRLREAITTHGMSKNRFYRIYRGILDRCNNPNASYFKHYGGRGIKCEWTTFNSFYQDMWLSYMEHADTFGVANTTIERTETNGNYCVSNCRWATKQEQGFNRRNNNRITFRGENLTVTEWCKKLNLNKPTFYGRLERGWSIERALRTPRLSQGTNSHPKAREASKI